MAKAEKAVYWRSLKGAGVALEKNYRDYTTAELQALVAEHGVSLIEPPPTPRDAPPPREQGPDISDQLAQLTQVIGQLVQLQVGQQSAAAAQHERVAAATERVVERRREEARPSAPARGELDRGLDNAEHAGLNANSHTASDVLYTDEFGNEWYQREVTKAGYAKPRGRRVLRTNDTKVETETITVGDYVETFEISGSQQNSQPTEIKVTLPSYQCGIYKPKNMPFKVHTYNGLQGFDRDDVQAYFGGRRLVPATVKSIYVHMDWCYEIASVISTIEAEYRERVLGTTVTQRGL